LSRPRIVDVALLQQVSAYGFACAPFEEDVVGHDDRGASVDRQQRLHMLDEVELLVRRRGPEVGPIVGERLPIRVPFSFTTVIDDFLPKGGLVMTTSARSGGSSFEIVLIREPIVTEDVAVGPELLDDAAGEVAHDSDSNSSRGSCDWRMIDCSVPIRISRWSGTGTVIVESDVRFCMTTWLPRRRTSPNPWDFRSVQSSAPEKTRSLPSANLQRGDVNVLMDTRRDFGG
jgi:hypothetical protein